MDNEEKVYVSEKEAAVYISVTPRTMQNWRRDGVGPPFTRLPNGTVRYDRGDLEDYMMKHRVDKSED